MALQIVFTLMTAGMGLSLASEGEGVGLGTGVFFAITAMASMFAGGSIAGRLSGENGLPTAALHGIVVWALVMIGVTWLGVSATGAALRGAGAAVQATGQTLGTVAGGAGGAVADAVSAVAPDLDEFEPVSLEALLPPSVEQDLRVMTRNENLTPEAIGQQGSEILGAVIDEEDLTAARDIAVGAGREMLRNPGDAEAIFEAAATEMTAPDGPLGESQFDELQGELEARYGVTPEESEEIAGRWRGEFVEARDGAIATYREAYDAAAQAVNEAVDAAAETAQAAADAASSVAWWSAIGGFLGLLAATAGAAFARPEDIMSDRVVVKTPPV
ncbi:MAG: hypothetical protein H0T41_00645 [Rhodobacteraceae bacterium]|nr:hypothetical protein [Paracoccaceae bacterium]